MNASKARIARNMQLGSYHQDLFKNERHIRETITTRGGVTSSTSAPKASLSLNLGAMVELALKR